MTDDRHTVDEHGDFVTDPITYAVYHWVDLASSYQMARGIPMGEVSAKATARLFDDERIKHYGSPGFVVSDEGPGQKGTNRRTSTET